LLDVSIMDTLLSGLSAWHDQVSLATDDGVQHPCTTALVRQLRIVFRKDLAQPKGDGRLQYGCA